MLQTTREERDVYIAKYGELEERWLSILEAHDTLVELCETQSKELSALASWRAEHEVAWDKLVLQYSAIQAKKEELDTLLEELKVFTTPFTAV